MSYMCWLGLTGLTGLVVKLWLPPLTTSPPATWQRDLKIIVSYWAGACWFLQLPLATKAQREAHLDRQVEVVADPPLQLLHVLAHPLHRLVWAVHGQLQLQKIWLWVTDENKSKKLLKLFLTTWDFSWDSCFSIAFLFITSNSMSCCKNLYKIQWNDTVCDDWWTPYKVFEAWTRPEPADRQDERWLSQAAISSCPCSRAARNIELRTFKLELRKLIARSLFWIVHEQISNDLQPTGPNRT